MKQAILAVAALAFPIAASAQPAAKPDVVVMPREVVAMALNWIGRPDATIAVQLYAAMEACLRNNPDPTGRVMRQGQDACPAVTEALAARDRAMTIERPVADPAVPGEKKP